MSYSFIWAIFVSILEKSLDGYPFIFFDNIPLQIIMDHAGCVLWPLSKLLGRRFFKIMSDRTLVTCIIYDNKLQVNYMITRVLYANMHDQEDYHKQHKPQPWWITSGELPVDDPEILFIPGDIIDSADGECSGIMYELSDQDLYKSDIFTFFSGYITDLINTGRLSILYEIASNDKKIIRAVKARKETYDSVVLSYIHMWRLGHQVTLSNISLLDIFNEISVPDNLITSLAEYHTLLAKGNNSFPKLVPLTEAEIMRPYDITLKFWRECEMLLVSTDLCYMYLGTGMPLMSVVCPIYGMMKNKYRNINILRKFRMSEKIVNDINEARVSLERNIRSDERLEKLANMNLSEYKMTDICGLIIMPYSGQSISHVLTGNQGTIIKDSFLWSLRERLLEPLVFKQLYLNWLITLSNLHLIGGIIHGDLHAGNVTMYTNYTGYEQKYVILDSDEEMKSTDNVTIMIQKSGEPYIGRIIDFSRSFLTGHGPLRERHNEVALQTVLDDQRNRLLRSIERAIPEIYKAHHKKIDMMLYDDPKWFKVLGVIDEIYLSRALLEIMKGINKGEVDANFISSRLQDTSGEMSVIKVPQMDVSKEILDMLSDFIEGAEKYILGHLIGEGSPKYFTKTFLKSHHFDSMGCTESTIGALKEFPVGSEYDDKMFNTGACAENAGNRCMSSTFSFGTTIRDDIYMALLDAGEKFPNIDKNKIRTMLDIHDRNEEWYILAENNNFME